ncbi:MAG: hypothetical protein Q8J59_06765, partial [Methylotenera sp.]|nr:hypothetical protein [Methylotenera sp.]MDP2101962.1 hypothetical protein [Methylotenera sp.]MDP2102905.1 hypothetical protein [Methylotenera sp.]MDP2281372.1 hypothetical protein [Methylotenera sp.]MDP3059412.1 hypothetical protein [Methylotenera sp.]
GSCDGDLPISRQLNRSPFDNVSKQLRSFDLRKDVGSFTFPLLRQILVELGTKEAFQGTSFTSY